MWKYAIREKNARNRILFGNPKRVYILQCVYVVVSNKPSKEDLKALELAHYQKIDISDGIYVLNIDGYVGESVRKEIVYAQQHGKEVIYHCN